MCYSVAAISFALSLAATTAVQAKVYRTSITMPAVVQTNGSAHAGPFATVDSNCRVTSTAAITILQKPRHGRLELGFGAGDANFSGRSACSRCNESGTRGSFVAYYPRTHFRGSDVFRILLSFEDGERRTVTIPVTVR